ncbi:MAG: tRNA (adenosine(37)-N6)-dimethylallyltransferase MiaA [Calditrichaeota bacterium]|nr:tRNA (adenosine(37)-N6)-dimethylallyltransferase MiaA [Calditrichota bacterium]
MAHAILTEEANSAKVIFVIGPTGVGKTELSLVLAEKLGNAEIVSADSRQVYKYMDIGTAKPTPEELARIKHHFIDIKFPDEYYSAGQFGREARQTIRQLMQQNKTPLVVGGSGLYIRALADGFFEKEIFDPQVKLRLKQEISANGAEKAYERLKRIDPDGAEKIHPNDAHRIVRALEVYELTGAPLSQFQKQAAQKAGFEPLFFGLTRERQKLYQMIEQRVDHMLEQGLVEEVRDLRNRGYSADLNSMQTVGYREVFDYLRGDTDYDEMARLIKQHTRNYAKRQLTWFRKDERIRWVNLDEGEAKDKWLQIILAELEEG